MTDATEELVTVRRLLQEAVARAEAAELEKERATIGFTRHIEELARDLEEARRELARLRTHQADTTGGL